MSGNGISTVKMLVQYDGTAFHGWQRMAGVPTVQQSMQDALKVLLREDVELSAAGRTDAGVHAAGQVVSFTCSRELDERGCHRLMRGASALLAPNIVVRDVRVMAPGFHARQCAIGKQYVYSVHNAQFPPLFTRPFRWHICTPLNVEEMQRAAEILLGEQDFEAFRASGCQARHACRYLWKAAVFRHGDDVHIELRGNAFVRSQVRITAGTLVEVGMGARTVENVQAILASRDRRLAGRTAPPEGLCLARVYYPEDVAEAGIPPGARWPGWPDAKRSANRDDDGEEEHRG